MKIIIPSQSNIKVQQLKNNKGQIIQDYIFVSKNNKILKVVKLSNI